MQSADPLRRNPYKKDLYRRGGKGRRCCFGTELIKFLTIVLVQGIIYILSTNNKDDLCHLLCTNPSSMRKPYKYFTLNLKVDQPTELWHRADLTLVGAGVTVNHMPAAQQQNL